MGKYFGTDGFRAEVNNGLCAEHAYKIGRFVGYHYSKSGKKARVLIGRDTRLSGRMLEGALCAGLSSSGADVYLLGVITTSAVSFLMGEGFDLGIVITASHNPYSDNGIKIMDAKGQKLPDSEIELIEGYIDGEESVPLKTGAEIGKIIDYTDGAKTYIKHLTSLFPMSLNGMKIGIDTANGAGCEIAKEVFSTLGAQIYTLGAEPNGININDGCGSTHIDALGALVKQNGLDFGFALDGDGDRCIGIDEKGCEVDGDKIMYIIATSLMRRGMLDKSAVVATVMSNGGFEEALKENGINCVRCAVGDRFVYEEMCSGGYCLGGEQSGHIIIKRYAKTGDGILTALALTYEIINNGSLSSLCQGVKPYPQASISVRVNNKDAVLENMSVKDKISQVRAQIKGGRVLIRKSGTEPVIRVMVECKDATECEKYAVEIAEEIKRANTYAN